MDETLSPRLADALAECARYVDRGTVYWWREASMQKLEAMGLVERYCPLSVAERGRMKVRPFRPTITGRAALASQEQANG